MPTTNAISLLGLEEQKEPAGNEVAVAPSATRPVEGFVVGPHDASAIASATTDSAVTH